MKEYKINIIIAAVISLIWVMIARKEYGYNYEFGFIFGLSLYPLILWTIGLVLLYLIYFKFDKKFDNLTKTKKTIYVILIYWLLLIFFETIFYHVFNIHNLNTAQYTGLPLCNCLHAPTWMKISYFSLGIIYLLIINNKYIKNVTKK